MLERGYTYTDLFELGILMIDNTTKIEQTIRHEIEQKCEEKIRNLKTNFNNRIDKLEKENRKMLNDLLYQTEYNQTSIEYLHQDIYQTRVNQVLEEIYTNVLKPRQDRIEQNNGQKNTVKPLTREFFEDKSRQTGLPTELIITECINRYTNEYLKQVNINIEPVMMKKQQKHEKVKV